MFVWRLPLLTDYPLCERGVGVRGGVLLVSSEELLEGPYAWRSQGDLWVYHGVYLVDLVESCLFHGHNRSGDFVA